MLDSIAIVSLIAAFIRDRLRHCNQVGLSYAPFKEPIPDVFVYSRDRLRDRFLALVRDAVANPISMRDVQEASLCGCSGKIVDIGVLEYILSLPPEQRFYLAIGERGTRQFPQ